MQKRSRWLTLLIEAIENWFLTFALKGWERRRVLLVRIQVSIAIERVDLPTRYSYGWDNLGCQCDVSREAVTVNFREALFSPFCSYYK